MSLFNLSATISGINASASYANIAADNIARRYVPESEANRGVASTLETGGVTVTTQKIPLTDEERNAVLEWDRSNIDFAHELVSYIPAQRGLEANVAVAKSSSTMLKSLLDIRI